MESFVHFGKDIFTCLEGWILEISLGGQLRILWNFLYSLTQMLLKQLQNVVAAVIFTSSP